MPTDKKLDYLELPASNFDAQQAFFEAVFDWQFTDYGEAYRAFTDGHIDGGFYLSEGQSLTKNAAALPIFYALNLESVQKEVEKAGGTILQGIFAFPGGRRFHFTDPHGNEYAVWSDQGLA